MAFILIKSFFGRKNYPRSEKIIIFSICASIAFPIIDSLANRYFNIAFWDSFLTKGIYYGSLILALYYSFKRFKRAMFFFPFFVLMLWVFSFIVYPMNRIFLWDILFSLTTSSLPLFIIVLAVRDFRGLFVALRETSIIIIICSILFVDFTYSGRLNIDYMNLSYYMQFAVMFMFIAAAKNRKVFDWIITFIGFLILFTMGARGALMGLLVGVFFYILHQRKINIKNIIILSLIIGFFIIYSINYENILQYFVQLLDQFNVSSRTIDLIIDNELFESSGRDSLFNRALIVISNNLMTGTGMAGDRATVGAYTHNLFTELLVEYGVLLGGLLIGILLYYLVKSLFAKRKNELYYIFVAVFFTTGFMKLQFSGSYSIEPMFFMMLALAYRLQKIHPPQYKVKRKYDKVVLPQSQKSNNLFQ